MALSAEEKALANVAKYESLIDKNNLVKGPLGMAGFQKAQIMSMFGLVSKNKKTVKKYADNRERQRKEDLTTFDARQNSLKDAEVTRRSMLMQGRQGTLSSGTMIGGNTLMTGMASMNPGIKTLLGQ